MKIISKYKDYYDYLTGIYGIDDNIVLDRRSDSIFNKSNIFDNETPVRINLTICDKLYTIFHYKGKLYHTQDDLEFLYDNTKIFDRSGFHRFKGILSIGYFRRARKAYDELNGDTKINTKLKEPILYYIGNSMKPKWEKGILLSDTGLPSYLPADEIYQNIYNFLSKMKDIEIIDNRSDKEKIESKGFDFKKSFRKRK